jgi:hypothetical protein
LEDDKKSVREKKGSNEKSRKGLRMKEGNTPEEDYEFIDLHGGRRYKRIKIGAGREESHNELEIRENCAHV